MPVRVLQDNVLVRPDEPATVSPGGIHLPDATAEKPTRGTVVAVGPGRHGEAGNLIAVEGLAVGDKVLYPKWGGNEVEVDGVGHKILRAGEVLAVLE